MPSPPLFRHKRRTHEGGNRTARELSHGERRCASDLSPRVRPSPHHVADCEAVSVAAAGGHHRSRCSTSVILLFTVSCPRLEPCFLFVVPPCPRFPAAMSANELASTPAMFNSTLTKDEAFLCPVDGSIMIIASHLPFNRNGFKFFTNAGGLGKTDIKDVLERAADIYNQFTAESLANSERKASSSIKQVDYMNVYTSDLVKAVRKAAGSIEKPLGGFHIVVDAGNGDVSF
ncbi:uncharacterized protein LOC107608236 [Arachis ipaensis]|uniref:uncharacterized protein LOC107608236 n=1 Tax=Arachis ipaensis TaxID=130454 RepID=UPI000A2B53E8|nr:uncharacterized protein LOC107608236 [Arachis ipaensis]